MKDHNYFDTYARAHKMRPVETRQAKFGKILLADSGDPVIEDGKIFYRTGYAIIRDGEGLDLASSADYEIGEPGGSQTEQKFRLDDAAMVATEVMMMLSDSGYYDYDRKGDFSPRPAN